MKHLKRGIILSLVAAMTVGSANAADWTESVKVKGDLRYRHELLDKDNDTADARHRQRLRARLAIEGQVSDAARIVFQVSSGSDDPISTNQTFDDAFTTKSIGIDLAYFELTPRNFKSLALMGGKMKNPFIIPGATELVWDSDLNPEGGALVLENEFDNVTVKFVGSGLWIDERSSGDDTWLGAGQVAARFHFNEKKSSVMVGGSFFNYVNVAGFPVFYDVEDPAGNTASEEDEGEFVYLNDYEILELFAEVSHKINDVPVMLVGDYVNNTAADSLETGWLVGAIAGKIKDPGSWEVRYLYRELERDAVVGAFTDSDFRDGGTDGKGHEFGAAYQIDKNMTLAGTYFLNTAGISGDDEYDFNRLQLDLQLKF